MSLTLIDFVASIPNWKLDVSRNNASDYAVTPTNDHYLVLIARKQKKKKKKLYYLATKIIFLENRQEYVDRNSPNKWSECISANAVYYSDLNILCDPKYLVCWIGAMWWESSAFLRRVPTQSRMWHPTWSSSEELRNLQLFGLERSPCRWEGLMI